MSPIVRFLIVAWGIAQIVSTSNERELIEISKDKPALFWTIEPNRVSTQTFLQTSKDWNSCNRTSKNDGNINSGYTFDLKLEYNIQSVWIEFARKQIKKPDFHIVIDSVLCTNYKLASINENSVNISLNCARPSGRSITIKPKNFDICQLKLYSCQNGKTGRGCKEDCQGTYGVSCSLPCTCKDNGTCSNTFGVCKSGCKESKRYTDCFFRSLAASPKNMYDDITRGAKLSAITATSYIKLDNNCHLLSLRGHSKHSLHVWVEYRFPKDYFITAVDGNFTKNNFETQIQLSITVNGSTCFDGKLIPTSQKRFFCNPKGIRGSTVRLKFMLNEPVDSKTAVVSLCGMRLLTCHSGFYGPHCRLPCNCLGSLCDPETGRCHGDDECDVGHSGTNCAEADISNNVIHTRYSGSAKDIPDLFVHGPKPLPSNVNQSAVFAAGGIDLKEPYRIKRVSVTIARDVADHVRNILVYFSLNSTSKDVPSVSTADNGLSTRGVVGLPCVNPTLGDGQKSSKGVRWVVDCEGPAAKINVVVLSQRPLPSNAIQQLGVWTCRDGTFGDHCESLCNCRYPDDVCDARTGQCPLGCRLGFGGEDCQTRICESNRCVKTCYGGSSCTSTCLPGWTGPSCDRPCPDGFFGDSCQLACFWCVRVIGDRTCHPTNGTCVLGCKHAYKEKMAECEQKFPIAALKMQASGQGQQPRPGLQLDSTNIFIVTFLGLMIGMIFSLYIVAMCSFKSQRKGRLDESSDHQNITMSGNKIIFASIADGWKWVESCNQKSGYYLGAFESDEQGLTHMQKVAIWILSQDFDAEIGRRKAEFAAGKMENVDKGDSSYHNGGKARESDEEEVHELYDVL